MDLDIKECIEYMASHELITMSNYDNLINALEEYHNDSDRLDACKSKFLIGEEVYVEKHGFDEEDDEGEYVENTSTDVSIAKITIYSICWKEYKKHHVYNYLYTEDEMFKSAKDLMAYLEKKYYNEYMTKLDKAKCEINTLFGIERGGQNDKQG